MRILRFDSIGGASGDMILATLIGLGIDIQTLRDQLASLTIENFKIERRQFSDYGLHGTQVALTVQDVDHAHNRKLTDIRTIVDKSDLTEFVKSMSLNVFESLAKAEARVHATSPEKIHFHETGAMDSIIDIAGSCLALNMLKIDKVTIGPLPLGSGTTISEHGLLPIPVPATVELLKEHPVVPTNEPFELVTPTGAALLMTWKQVVDGFSEKGCATPPTNGPAAQDRAWRSECEEMDKNCLIIKTANGFGHRKLAERPNLLRATIMETTRHERPSTDECVVLECNLDDTVPELLGALAQRLMKNGALDVFTTPIQMKKQRPGVLLTVLSRMEDRARFLDMIFSETTTFGVREYLTRRTMLERRHIEAETPYGKIRIKVGSWQGKNITFAPEHDDCIQCANQHSVPVRTVYESAFLAASTEKVD